MLGPGWTMVVHPAQCGTETRKSHSDLKEPAPRRPWSILRRGRWSLATFTWPQWPQPWFFTWPTGRSRCEAPSFPHLNFDQEISNGTLKGEQQKMIRSAKFTWYLNIMYWKPSAESASLWSRLDVLFISCLKPENSIYMNYHLSDMESPSRLKCGHQRKVVLGMLGEILCKHKQPKRYCSTAWSVHNVLLPAEWRTLDFSSNIEASIFRILQKLQAKNPWVLCVFKIVKISFQSHHKIFY